jgi:hypothetical protein
MIKNPVVLKDFGGFAFGKGLLKNKEVDWQYNYKTGKARYKKGYLFYLSADIDLPPPVWQEDDIEVVDYTSEQLNGTDKLIGIGYLKRTPIYFFKPGIPEHIPLVRFAEDGMSNKQWVLKNNEWIRKEI